jgi:hypothetical protein
MEDCDRWLRIAAAYNTGYIPEPLTFYQPAGLMSRQLRSDERRTGTGHRKAHATLRARACVRYTPDTAEPPLAHARLRAPPDWGLQQARGPRPTWQRPSNCCGRSARQHRNELPRLSIVFRLLTLLPGCDSHLEVPILASAVRPIYGVFIAQLCLRLRSASPRGPTDRFTVTSPRHMRIQESPIAPGVGACADRHVSATKNGQTTPAVSVIIPAYNSAPFIAQTLDSALSQSFGDYEVIVVNDGSPDTPDFERALRPYWTRIVYLIQQNGGPSAARNLAIRHARGEYVAFLDSDDLWMPEYLANQMRILAAEPTLDLLYSNGLVIGDVQLAGRELMSIAPSRGKVTFERLIAIVCTVHMSCVVARRQSLIDVGLFDERFRRSEDFHLWARLAYRGARIGYHRRVLVLHRRRPGSLSDDRMAMTKGAIEVLQDLERTLPLTAEQQTLIRQHIARCHAVAALEEGKQLFMAGEYDRAAAAFEHSRAFEPDRWRQTRLRALRVGLRVAPRLMRRTYSLLRGSGAPAPASSPS